MAENDSIEASPKHGVNPSLVTCFWCEEERGDIALLGRIRTDDNDDAEAPKHVVLDYEPCEKCKKNFEAGILVVNVETEPLYDSQPEFIPGGYPTGRWALVTEDGFKKTFETLLDDQSLVQSALKERVCALDSYVFDLVFDDAL